MSHSPNPWITPPISHNITQQPHIPIPSTASVCATQSMQVTTHVQRLTAMATTNTGQAAMLAPGTLKAPKTFDGKDSELEDFLDHFETLADAAKLTDSDYIAQVGKYTTRKQHNLFEVLDGYDPVDWGKFKKSLSNLYPNAFKACCYTCQSLKTFTAKAAWTEIADEDELNDYYCAFLPVAQWLVT